MSATSLTVLEYLRRQIEGRLRPADTTHLRYPTAISRLLDIELVKIAEQRAVVQMVADVDLHGNQQGTIHGGLLCELADAAIGTAHSTVIQPGESFASMDLHTRFLRPAWSGTLVAFASCTHRGRTVSQYECQIRREDGTTIATATSAVMTLRGEAAVGR
ncbi:MAG: PaaI family thioesterase [Leifsonia sp.]